MFHVIKKNSAFLALLLSLVFTSSAFAETLYFNADGGDWHDSNNWYYDVDLTNPLLGVPASGDDVIVVWSSIPTYDFSYGDVVVLNSIDASAAGININNNLNSFVTTLWTHITGNVTFSGDFLFQGTVVWDAIFLGGGCWS